MSRSGLRALQILLGLVAVFSVPAQSTQGEAEAPTRRTLLPLVQVIRLQGPPQRVSIAVDILSASGAPVLPEIMTLVLDPDPRVRSHSFSILERLGPKAKSAAALVQKRFERETGPQKIAAARAIIGIDPTRLAIAETIEKLGTSSDRRFLIEIFGDRQVDAGLPFLIRALGDEGLRRDALRALASLGEKSAPALPSLISLLRSARNEHKLQLRGRRIDITRDLRREGIRQTIVAVGEAAVAPLVASFDTADAAMRARIVLSLREIEDPSPRVLNLLESQLTNEQPGMPKAATDALLALLAKDGIPPTRILELGVAILDANGDDADIQKKLTWILARDHDIETWLRQFDKAPPPQRRLVISAVPAIQKADRLFHQKRFDDVVLRATRDPAPAVRIAACDALLGHRFDFVESALLHLLADPVAACRKQAAISVGRFDLVTDASIDALRTTLADDDAEVRIEALRSLGRLGPAAALAISAVRKSLLGRSPAEQDTAFAAMIRILPSGAERTALLRDGYREPGPRREAVSKLFRLRPDVLNEVVAGSNDELLHAALSWVTRTKKQGLVDHAHLEKLLTHKVPAIRTLATRALADDVRLGTPPNALRTNLRHSSVDLRAETARLLGSYGPQASEYAVDLTRQLSASSPSERRAAANALAQLGKACSGVVPQIVLALESRDGLVVRALLRALRAAASVDGVDLEFAIPALRRVAGKGPRMARSMARSLLRRL